jgi:hypothetical protein
MYLYHESAEDRLKDTFFVVEATSYEQFCLWEKYSLESRQSSFIAHENRMKWEQISPGWLVTVGKLDGRPCCISTQWNRISGKLVLFWYSCSQVTDSVMAEKWITEHFTGTWDSGTRRAWTDAQNFHHCCHAIDEANKSDQ